ncbi:Gfo/Idh/MocA family oxidoreductase [Membranicola marinus]|uniref:Gfo/Idh/MocA family oxidoreductase n=1 Tax=Membranihabitans marinus TaxID=1227546 RepID=A0A953HXY1_9BACT|nr:Gfo/Idh/MocA family oxidoreductase [Membranihabitans marinus]MBY5958696.1 Gfo/Idh/MocA family oxidoreductase [Membranihabitans marinus]
MHKEKRRKFLKTMGLTTAALGAAPYILRSQNSIKAAPGKRVGIIGLDTSHSIAFTKAMNVQNHADLLGYKVVAAYPHGSKDIESSVKRIPGYIKDVQEMGVEVVDSIDAMLEKVDVVLLETNDGRRHLEQVLPVLKAGKRVFVDKPVAASLEDTLKIYAASKEYGIPIFSASSLRYIKGAKEVAEGKVGRVLGANTWSPAKIEKTHPDMYWYGVHGVETLFTVMGTGCQEVSRVHTEGCDVITGVWDDGRVGVFRGQRAGKPGYGGHVFGEKGGLNLGPYQGYLPLLVDVAHYFDTGEVPVTPEETIEIFAFMSAADVSKKKKGKSVRLDKVLKKAGA